MIPSRTFHVLIHLKPTEISWKPTAVFNPTSEVKLRHIEVNKIPQLVTNNAGIQTQFSSIHCLNPLHKWPFIHIRSVFWRLKFVSIIKLRSWLIDLLYYKIRYNYTELNITMLSINFTPLKKFSFLHWHFLPLKKLEYKIRQFV